MMEVIQIASALANGGAIVIALAAVVYMLSTFESIRREHAAQTLELRAEFATRELAVRQEFVAREGIMREEYQRRESMLMNQIRECSDKWEKVAGVLTRLEAWLRKTD